MQRSQQFRIETRLINDLSITAHARNSLDSEENLGKVKNVKELRKFFNGFKRAMHFGLWGKKWANNLIVLIFSISR